MLLDITHLTDYHYTKSASEAYLETRLTPPAEASQEVLAHEIEYLPEGEATAYTDFFGNHTEFFAMTLRHDRLKIKNHLKVRTSPPRLPQDSLRVTFAEARQILASQLPDVFDYLHQTPVVPTGGEAARWASRHLRGGQTVGRGLESLNTALHRRIAYVPGVTDNATPLARVWRTRKGVCQDFAHLMLSVLRTGGLPARYVCGYIDAGPRGTEKGGKAMVGALATHAWVEVLVPGGHWIGLDPTNNCWEGEQHVKVSVGRDFREAAPVRGTFKTAGKQTMHVRVRVRRLKEQS